MFLVRLEDEDLPQKTGENYNHQDPLEGFKSDKHTKEKMVTIFTFVKNRYSIQSLSDFFAMENKLRQFPDLRYGVYKNELKMETYLWLQQCLSGPHKLVINILGGRKLMLACQVTTILLVKFSLCRLLRIWF